MGTAASIITGIILAGICIALVLASWACLVASAVVDRRDCRHLLTKPPTAPVMVHTATIATGH